MERSILCASREGVGVVVGSDADFPQEIGRILSYGFGFLDQAAEQNYGRSFVISTRGL